MTVIAWDGKTLAADKMLGDSVVWRRSTKIRRHGDCLIAAAGDADISREVAAWFLSGADPERFPASARSDQNLGEMLVIRSDKQIELYQRTPHPIIVDEQVFALGSGRDAAMAVMALGHDAITAVEIANQFCAGCGGGVDHLTLSEDSP